MKLTFGARTFIISWLLICTQATGILAYGQVPPERPGQAMEPVEAVAKGSVIDLPRIMGLVEAMTSDEKELLQLILSEVFAEKLVGLDQAFQDYLASPESKDVAQVNKGLSDLKTIADLVMQLPEPSMQQARERSGRIRFPRASSLAIGSAVLAISVMASIPILREHQEFVLRHPWLVVYWATLGLGGCLYGTIFGSVAHYQQKRGWMPRGYFSDALTRPLNDWLKERNANRVKLRELAPFFKGLMALESEGGGSSGLIPKDSAKWEAWLKATIEVLEVQVGLACEEKLDPTVLDSAKISLPDRVSQVLDLLRS